jgi:anti-anti-sigma regulatory factor/HAMP domain-containing protein
MYMKPSLRLGQKLFIIMVGGSIILALVLSVITLTALFGGRDRALAVVSEGLETQGRTDLQLLIYRDAILSSERLASATSTGYIDTQAIAGAIGAELANPSLRRQYRLTALPNGVRTDTQAGQVMTVVVPQQADEAAALTDLQDSLVLEVMVPAQDRMYRDFVSFTYVGTSGAARIYPAIDPATADLERMAGFLDLFKDNGRGQLWLPPFKSPRQSGLIWTVVTPIYDQQTFKGVVAIDIVLSQVTFDIAENLPTPGSLIFLIDDQRTLITAPPESLPLLTGQAAGQQPISLLDSTYPLTMTASPELDSALSLMAAGEKRVERLLIDDHAYFLAYAPIEGTSWRLGLLTPIDELTGQAALSAQSIVSASQETLRLMILITVVFVGLLAIASRVISRRISGPLVQMAAAAQALGRGEYEHPIPLSSQDEVGQVAVAFRSMRESVVQAYAQLAEQNQSLEGTVQTRTEELQSAVAQLEQTLAQQAATNDLLRRLSTPVIPVLRGVLLMPLIGALDADRAQQTLQALLRHVADESARLVIIDVTGLSTIDESLALTLIHAAQSARLLGARTMLVGLRPEAAQTLISLGTSLDELQPVADLQTAIMLAMKQRDGRVSSRQT